MTSYIKLNHIRAYILQVGLQALKEEAEISIHATTIGPDAIDVETLATDCNIIAEIELLQQDLNAILQPSQDGE